jgi:DNA-3-methyladenine glycosylase II
MTMMTANQMYSVTGKLSPRAPFDYTKTLSFLYGFGPTGGEQAFTGQTLTKAIMLNERAVAFEVWSEEQGTPGAGSSEKLAYRLSSEQPLSEEEHAALVDRMRFFLSLDDDLGPFYATGRADPAFAPVIERLYGLHQPKFLTPFELACWAILGQRIPWRIAHRTKLALVERFGTSITLHGEVYRAFLEPQQLARVEPGELAKVVRNERKVEYLRAVIQFFNEVDEQFLRYGPFEEVAARIRGIRGIGEWSAHFILVRGLGRMERVSSTDRELLDSAARIYNGGQPITPAELQRILDRYGNTQGYWAFYARNAFRDISQAMEAMD